jgi:hypothetical protein
MGVACDIYEIEEKFSQGFGEETWRKKNIWKT